MIYWFSLDAHQSVIMSDRNGRAQYQLVRKVIVKNTILAKNQTTCTMKTCIYLNAEVKKFCQRTVVNRFFYIWELSRAQLVTLPI